MRQVDISYAAPWRNERAPGMPGSGPVSLEEIIRLSDADKVIGSLCLRWLEAESDLLSRGVPGESVGYVGPVDGERDAHRFMYGIFPNEKAALAATHGMTGPSTGQIHFPVKPHNEGVPGGVAVRWIYTTLTDQDPRTLEAARRACLDEQARWRSMWENAALCELQVRVRRETDLMLKATLAKAYIGAVRGR